MRIRILDPHWNKMDPDPGSALKLNGSGSKLVYAERDEPFSDKIFYIISRL